MFSSIAGGTTGFAATTAGYIAACFTATGTTFAAALAAQAPAAPQGQQAALLPAVRGYLQGKHVFDTPDYRPELNFHMDDPTLLNKQIRAPLSLVAFLK